MSNFKIYKKDDSTYIESLSFPRFKGKITFGQLSDIEGIELIDKDADVMEMAKALREAGDYISNYSEE